MYTLRTIDAAKLLDVFTGAEKAMHKVGVQALAACAPTFQVSRNLFEDMLAELANLGKTDILASRLALQFAEVK